MTLKLSSTEVRVRLSRKNADALARGEALRHEVRLPNGALAWHVDPGGDALGLALVGGELSITVPAAAMKALLEQPESRDAGIHASVGGVALVVEIDLWSGRKRE